MNILGNQKINTKINIEDFMPKEEFKHAPSGSKRKNARSMKSSYTGD